MEDLMLSLEELKEDLHWRFSQVSDLQQVSENLKNLEDSGAILSGSRIEENPDGSIDIWIKPYKAPEKIDMTMLISRPKEEQPNVLS
jgi:hypothetical protein